MFFASVWEYFHLPVGRRFSDSPAVHRNLPKRPKKLLGSNRSFPTEFFVVSLLQGFYEFRCFAAYRDTVYFFYTGAVYGGTGYDNLVGFHHFFHTEGNLPDWNSQFAAEFNQMLPGNTG